MGAMTEHQPSAAERRAWINRQQSCVWRAVCWFFCEPTGI